MGHVYLTEVTMQICWKHYGTTLPDEAATRVQEYLECPAVSGVTLLSVKSNYAALSKPPAKYLSETYVTGR